jgi:hypothetical protein
MQMSPALNQRWLPQPSSPRLTHSSGYSSNCSRLRTEMESAHVEIPISNPLLHVAKKNPIPIPSNFNSPILERSETFSQWYHAAPSLPFHLVDLLSHFTVDLQLRDSVLSCSHYSVTFNLRVLSVSSGYTRFVALRKKRSKHCVTELPITVGRANFVAHRKKRSKHGVSLSLESQ